MPAGETTFFREIRTLPPGYVTALAPREGDVRSPLPPLALNEDDPAPPDLEAATTRHLARLRRLTASYRRAFGGQVNLLFSGGYDSRLLLGLLLEAGVRPRITVYGAGADPDCRIARQVAEGEGLSFNHVDKSKVAPIPREDQRDHLLRNYAAFDGWKLTGLFDSGADITDRAAQVADGSVKMNGSLGEIYRNFFYLPERRFSARAGLELLCAQRTGRLHGPLRSRGL